MQQTQTNVPDQNSIVNTYPLHFFTEYYQFYIKDATSTASTDSDVFWTTEASEDKLAVENGLLGISVAKYATVKVDINVYSKEPIIFTDDEFDHIVEASIEIISGELQVLDCTSMALQLNIELAPGIYTVRSKSANLKTVQGDTGEDFYVLDIYPSQKKERNVIKKYTS